MRDFRSMQVWEKAHQVTLAIYPATCDFPQDERFGLVSQMRRVCASIPANIAHGCGCGSDHDFARYLFIAMGSASELEYDLLLARDIGLMNDLVYEQLMPDLVEVKRMLAGLIKKLRGES
jgi:four helix bundle protein